MKARATVGNQRASSRKQRKQQHLLDVKVRSRKAAQQRNRRAVVWFCWLVLVAGVIGGAAVGAREGLRRFFWQNPDYNLAEIEIKDDGPLAREQVLAATGLREGVNIFSIDIAQMRASLMAMPQVEHAEVERVLPGKITIDISERKPVAWVAARNHEDPTTDRKSFLVDRKGVLMRTGSNVTEYFHLPVIHGLPTDNFDPGETVGTPEMKAALDLIRLTAENPARFQVYSIDLSLGYCMVVTDQRRSRITFGLEHVDAQLERLNVLLDYIEKNGREIQTANLLVQRNVPVTFAQQPDPNAAIDEADATPTPSPIATPSEHVKKPLAKSSATPKANHAKKKTSAPTPVRRALPVESHRTSRSNG